MILIKGFRYKLSFVINSIGKFSAVIKRLIIKHSSRTAAISFVCWPTMNQVQSGPRVQSATKPNVSAGITLNVLSRLLPYPVEFYC